MPDITTTADFYLVQSLNLYKPVIDEQKFSGMIKTIRTYQKQQPEHNGTGIQCYTEVFISDAAALCSSVS